MSWMQVVIALISGVAGSGAWKVWGDHRAKKLDIQAQKDRDAIAEAANAQRSLVENLMSQIDDLRLRMQRIEKERDEERFQKHELREKLQAMTLKCESLERDVQDYREQVSRLEGQLSQHAPGHAFSPERP